MGLNHFWKLAWVAASTRRHVVLTLGISAFLAAPVSGMDLKEAFDLALVSDAKYRASLANAEVTREKLPQARAQLWPSVSFSASRNQNRLSRQKPTETQESYISENQTLSLRQPLFRKPQWIAVAQAHAEVQGGEAVLAFDKIDLLTRLLNAFAEASVAEQHLTLARSKKLSMANQLQAASMALTAGTGTRTDIDEAKARYDMAIAEELEAQQHLSYSIEAVELMTGQRLGKLSTLDPDRMRELLPPTLTFEEWWLRAEANSPELQYWRHSVDVARLEVDKARAGHYPTLDVVAQVVHSAAENVTSTSSNYRNRVLGLQLSVPLFSGGAIESSIRQAHARAESAEASLESVRRDLRLRLRKEFRGVTEGHLRIQALEQAVRSSEQMVVSSRRSYAAGARTLLDVLEAEHSHQLALRDLSQARYSYLTAWVLLQALSGEEPEAAVLTVNGWLR